MAASPAPTSELSFEMVQAADCDPTPRTPEETAELFSRLEDALIKQIEVVRTRLNCFCFLLFCFFFLSGDQL